VGTVRASYQGLGVEWERPKPELSVEHDHPLAELGYYYCVKVTFQKENSLSCQTESRQSYTYSLFC
jgi:hypothetical protein